MLSSVASGQASERPPDWPQGLIWDDFTYDDADEVAGRSEWCMVSAGRLPADPDDCRLERRQLWYETNWAERYQGPPGQIRVRSGSRDELQLLLAGGRSYDWGRTPTIISGFTRRTGSWYARVRLQDLSRRQPGSSTSFWMMSPYWACADVSAGAPCTAQPEKHWSEWNFEWTHFWTVHRGTSGPWMSTGAVTDGDASAVGGIPLRAGSDAPPFTCRTPRGDVLEWNSCRSYFINGTNRPSEDGPYADLMVRFDGNHAEWEVIAYANNRRLPHDWVRLQARSPELGAGQPVMTLFSITPRMNERVSADVWYVADWFIYSPHTDRGIEDFIAAAEWLGDRAGIPRMSSTGIRLERPSASTGLLLESVDHGLSPGTFLAIPPENQLTYYDLFWSYRVATGIDGAGAPVFEGSWRELADHSFRVRIPDVLRYPYSEVRVRYRLHQDQFGVHVGPIPMAREATSCVASTNSGRTFSSSCR